MNPHPGILIRDARLRYGLSQGQLALRAGTTQSAISRLENGDRSPSIETLERLLLVLGERLVLTAERRPTTLDARQVRRIRALDPAERLERALHWNSLAAEIAHAGKSAREAMQ